MRRIGRLIIPKVSRRGGPFDDAIARAGLAQGAARVTTRRASVRASSGYNTTRSPACRPWMTWASSVLRRPRRRVTGIARPSDTRYTFHSVPLRNRAPRGTRRTSSACQTWMRASTRYPSPSPRQRSGGVGQRQSDIDALFFDLQRGDFRESLRFDPTHPHVQIRQAATRDNRRRSGWDLDGIPRQKVATGRSLGSPRFRSGSPAATQPPL